MRVVLVGAGRLASQLGPALQRAGHDVAQVYSRTMASATALATRLHALATDRLADVAHDADVYVVAVKDDALADVVAQLCPSRGDALFVHTAGSMPMDVFRGQARRYGVFYPMQTFSKEREVDFREIPCFVEGVDAATQEAVRALAASVSGKVYDLSSAERQYLHVAAVFACNFTNHCYDIAARLLAEHGLPFEVMHGLVDETARKVHELSPSQAQTGPAVRYDEQVIGRHLALLADHPAWQDLYARLSQSIHQA